MNHATISKQAPAVSSPVPSASNRINGTGKERQSREQATGDDEPNGNAARSRSPRSHRMIGSRQRNADDENGIALSPDGIKVSKHRHRGGKTRTSVHPLPSEIRREAEASPLHETRDKTRTNATPHARHGLGKTGKHDATPQDKRMTLCPNDETLRATTMMTNKARDAPRDGRARRGTRSPGASKSNERKIASRAVFPSSYENEENGERQRFSPAAR